MRRPLLLILGIAAEARDAPATASHHAGEPTAFEAARKAAIQAIISSLPEAARAPSPPLDVARYPCYRVIVIRSFKDQGTDEIFNGKNTKDARRSCPQSLWVVAARKLDQLDSAGSLEDLRIPPGNRLEALSGDRDGQYSVRINDQYRVCFVWRDNEPGEVEIVDYH